MTPRRRSKPAGGLFRRRRHPDTSIASANPVILNPSLLLAFFVVAFWAMVVEAGAVAFAACVPGRCRAPIFSGYFVLNTRLASVYNSPERNWHTGRHLTKPLQI